MQNTDFKQCGAEINITRCEDYKNTFVRIESACTLRFGVKVLMKSISYNRQSVGPEGSSRARSCNVWQWRRTVVYVLLHGCVNVRTCSLHNLYRTGHIGSYKQHTVR